MMTKGEFGEAFRTVFSETINREAEECPETPHVFSDEFDNRMSLLIRRGTAPSRKMVKAGERKAVLVFLSLVLIISVMMEMPGIRAASWTWIRFIFNGFSTAGTEEKSEETDIRYTFSYIPKGFHEEKTERKGAITEQLYTDQSGCRMTFVQIPKEATIEIEEQAKKMVRLAVITVGAEKTVKICEVGRSWAFVWSEEEAVLMIRYDGSILQGDFSPVEIIRMIDSVKAVQE